MLDLFGGSGQLAIEALSRGAAYGVIVDQSAEAVKIIKENLKKVHFDQITSVFQMDYMRYLSTTREKFDIIFLDPPYREKFLENALQKISEIDILSEGGIIICERAREKVLPPVVGDLICSKDYLYGKTAVNLYTR